MHPSPKILAAAGLASALAMTAVPASAAMSDLRGSAATSANHSGRVVTAVVTVRPGASLPVRVPGGHVTQVFRGIGSEVVRAPMSALARLAADPRVAGVSPDRSGRVAGKDDAAASGAGVFAADSLGGQAGKPGTGRGVNVALLDTGLTDTAALDRASGRVTDGVDVSHLAAGGEALTSGQFTDGYGHGTFLASLIAGGRVPGSGKDALGVAPAARIVVVKVADDQGNTSLSQVLAGLDWVAAHAQAIQVVNIALAVDRPTGSAYGMDPLTAAVEHVRDAGVLVVAAAGNTPGQVGDPGLDPQSLTVGAADLTAKQDQVASFSGSGVVAGVSKPDVVASGVRLLGLVPPGSAIAQAHPSAWQPNGLFRGSGTSEATAVASGVAAAWYSDHPGASPAAAKAALRAGAGGKYGATGGAGLVHMVEGRGPGRPGDLGESSFDSQSWQTNAFMNGDWASWLASSWSASSWSASSWSAATWSASSWSASSWSASSWSASSWSASSWSASSWSAYGWGDDA